MRRRAINDGAERDQDGDGHFDGVIANLIADVASMRTDIKWIMRVGFPAVALWQAFLRFVPNRAIEKVPAAVMTDVIHLLGTVGSIVVAVILGVTGLIASIRTYL